MALLVLGSAGALAQSGGSMGGGSWGSSSSSSSSSTSTSSSSSSSRSYGGTYGSSDRDSSSRSYGDAPGPGCDGGSALWLVLAVIGAMGYALFKMANFEHVPVSPSFSVDDQPSAWGRAEADVSVLRFALDARVRKFVQAELARIAKVADTASADGRAVLLREVALLLRRCRDAWVYGGAINLPMTTMDDAKRQFDRHVDDARGRFVHELVRNQQGVVTTAAASAPGPRASGDDQGLVVVTLVVAARTELFSVRHIGTGDDLRQALESASNHSARDLIAIEIVWMPADEREQLSSIAVETKYPAPDLVKISGAMVGKTVCAYCAGPYPAELVSCPHCGGKAAA